MDLIIFLLAIGMVIFFFKDFVAFVYAIGIIEIFLRVIHFISNNIGANELSTWMNNNFPSSIFNIIAKYSNGLFYDVLCWLLIVCFIVLDFHLIKYFIKRK